MLTRSLFKLLAISLCLTGCQNPVQLYLAENVQKIESLELNETKDDLHVLKEIIGDAELVCLGESRHDIREQFLLKNRMVKYLVEELGFTNFVLEASLPYSSQINDFILHQKGDLDQIMANLPGWFLWDTEEIKELLLWMKSFNQTAPKGSKVHFYGCDIVAPNNGLEQIISYLDHVDLEAARKYRGRNFGRDLLVDEFWQSSMQNIASLTTEQKKEITENYTELYNHIHQNRSKYQAASSNELYGWILQLAFSAKEANRLFSAQDPVEGGLIRDSAMAANTIWAHKKHGTSAKTIVWAHNVHIIKDPFIMTAVEGTIKGMGYVLHQELQDEMISIGATFYQGEYPQWGKSFPPANIGSFEDELNQVNQAYFILDLTVKNVHEIVYHWLNIEQTIRGQEFEMTFVPARSFDAIFFTRHITRTTPNQQSLAKFRN